jgi:hypothetical protein
MCTVNCTRNTSNEQQRQWFLVHGSVPDLDRVSRGCAEKTTLEYSLLSAIWMRQGLV